VNSPTILLLAGEPSGDRHGASLVSALRTRYPKGRFVGTGGHQMEAEGVELIERIDKMAVMGFVEVLPRLPFLWALERKLVKAMDALTPDLVVLIDYPGFNMRMAKAASDRGLSVLYYITPQLWAWRPTRARRLAATVDRAAVILPFEEGFFRERGVDAYYVGHPLLDRPDDVCSRDMFFDRWGLDPSRPILAMLPGSREQELKYHLAAFSQIAARVLEKRPDVLPVFARAKQLHAGPFIDSGHAVVDDSRALLRYAGAALVKSGTSTLEAVLEGTPFVTAYRMSAVTHRLAQRLIEVDYISLPNLIAGARVVPEFIQDDLNADSVAPVLLELLDVDSIASKQQSEGFERVRKSLGGAGASDRVAALATELIEGSPQ
jgi:lipid-A-disaccharide synthase